MQNKSQILFLRKNQFKNQPIFFSTNSITKLILLHILNSQVIFCKKKSNNFFSKIKFVSIFFSTNNFTRNFATNKHNKF